MQKVNHVPVEYGQKVEKRQSLKIIINIEKEEDDDEEKSILMAEMLKKKKKEEEG